MRLLYFLMFSVWLAHGQNAVELLKESDKARGAVGAGLSWNLVINTEEDGEASSREFVIKVKGTDAHVEATGPARNKGEIYIFNDRNMWFYKPSLKKPVSISARQKLSGQAANGDIASTNYARDYDPVVETTEEINKEKVHVLMLKAKANNLTYDKIRYWISEKSKLAIKAEFLNLQGKPFKVGEMIYKNSITLEGKSIPFISELKITDAKFPKNFSVIKYLKPKHENVPVSLFSVNNLSR